MREMLRHCVFRSATGGANNSMDPTGSLNIADAKKQRLDIQTKLWVISRTLAIDVHQDVCYLV